jgi:hypothetical protein
LQPEQEEANFRIAESLREAGIPVVLIDRDLTDFPKRSDFGLVGIDNLKSSSLVCPHSDVRITRHFPRYFDGLRIRSSRSASISLASVRRRRFRKSTATVSGSNRAFLKSWTTVRQMSFRMYKGDFIRGTVCVLPTSPANTLFAFRQ